MKRSFVFVLAIIYTSTISSQLFREDELVQVDPLISNSQQGTWQNAYVVSFDSVVNKYTVKLSNGDKVTIPSKTPEQWIRPVVNMQKLNQYGPGARIAYENRNKVLKADDCKPSEAYIKKKIKAQMATQYKDYPFINVDFTSFKGQKGYTDKTYPNENVYPYKIEMLVHLKRTLIFGGKPFTEYQTWEYDREYNYATRAGRKCEFYPAQTKEPQLISRGWY